MSDNAKITFAKITDGAYTVLLGGESIGSVWKSSNCWTATPPAHVNDHVVVPWIRRREAVDQLVCYATR